MKKWKIAVVGCGDIAELQYMAQMYKIEKAEVIACCDIQKERTDLFQKKFGIKNAYSNADELLAKEDFDIMMNLTSIPFHYSVNLKALRAGKHLYSQKPIALTVQEANELIETAKKSGVKFSASPVHMLRPVIRNVKRLIDGGVIGKVTLVRSVAGHGGPEYFQYRENDPSWFYETGAGALYDVGVHALQWVTGLLGPAKEVSCTAAISSPERMVRSGTFNGKIIKSNKLPDNYLIHLNFGNGVLADVVTGFCMKASNCSELEIYGEKGSIIFPRGLDTVPKIYIDDQGKAIRGWIDCMPQEREIEFYQCYCIADLIEAIENDRPVGLPAEHARHVIEIICSIEKCAKDGKIHRLETAF
jgi:predicted dehydrogenase